MPRVLVSIWAGLALLSSATLSGGGCGDRPAESYYVPACEPADELLVERSLKEGFRMLYRGDLPGAKRAFAATLSLAPSHPEAMDGLREVRLKARSSKAAPAKDVNR